MRLVLIGAPGSGKGTLAKELEKEFGWLHISTGDILRDEIAHQTEIGRIAKELIGSGNFVPDEIIIKMVENRLKEDDAKNGYILDGFPRTLSQLNKMNNFIDVDIAIFLDVDDDVLIERLTSRKVCPKCKEVYSSKYYKENTCERCGTELLVREDDKLESILKRLEIYKNETQPIVECLKAEGKLLTFKGDRTPDETYKLVLQALDKIGGIN